VDTNTKIAALVLASLYVCWMYGATLLYRKIDAQFASVVPIFRGQFQLFTDGASLLALLRFLCSRRPKTLNDPTMHRLVRVLRLVAIPLLFSWACFLYLALKGHAP
jgi:hypothetical protein